MDTDRPDSKLPQDPDLRRDGEAMADRDLAPEVHNADQDDEPAQAQSLADEALGRSAGVESIGTERVPGSDDDTGGMPDLVDHMNQMVTSGRIDMSAFRGERSDDDEEGMYGEAANEDETPGGAE
jgi:hypothetical protein